MPSSENRKASCFISAQGEKDSIGVFHFVLRVPHHNAGSWLSQFDVHGRAVFKLDDQVHIRLLDRLYLSTLDYVRELMIGSHNYL